MKREITAESPWNGQIQSMMIEKIRVFNESMYVHKDFLGLPHSTNTYEYGCKAIQLITILSFYFYLKTFKVMTKLIEPPHGKTNNLHRRKQRCRSASQ